MTSVIYLKSIRDKVMGVKKRTNILVTNVYRTTYKTFYIC